MRFIFGDESSSKWHLSSLGHNYSTFIFCDARLKEVSRGWKKTVESRYFGALEKK